MAQKTEGVLLRYGPSVGIDEISTKAPAASIRLEVELLLCCARTCTDSAIVERIRALLREDIDWAYLTHTALQHGVMPLLYRSLYTTCPEAVPGAILDQLRGHFYANALRNFFLTRELLRLLKLFEAHGIPAIPYKGPVLAASVYGDLALRQFGDLDILVYQRDVPRAKDLLISQGYRLRGLRTSAQEEASLQVRHHYLFVSDDGRVTVELHWRIMERHFPFPLDPERLWERIEWVSLAGAMVRHFLPEDLLLILCVHGSKPWHCWQRLGWICDVAELIRVHQGLDWGRVMAQAGRLGSERRLFLGLCLARDLLGTALPEEVRQRMQADPVVKSLAAQVCERLFREADDPPGGFAEFRFHLRAIERRQDRVRSCLHFALTKTVITWALRPPISLLSFPYSLLDRVPTRNVWLWPLPLFALLCYLYHLLLPIRRVAKYGLRRVKRLP